MLLVVVDSSKTEYRYVREGFFCAFEHLGMPYQVIDLAKEKLTPESMIGSSAMIIAQEGMGENFSSATGNGIKKAIEERGIGLVSFDHRLSSYPSVLRHTLSGTEGDISFSQSKGLKVTDDSHFITRTYEKNEKGAFLQDIELATLSAYDQRETGLVASLDGYPILRIANSGQGKLAQFLVSPKMWHSDYFGHFCGFDGLFWRSIVWVAQKPFVMMMLPPFVACRIDDANGSANIFGKREDSANRSFAYLDTLNKYGYIPNIGLFIDDITESDGKIIKEAYHKGLAQFSPHAFSDPENINEHPIYMLHNGEELSFEELRENFARVDKKLQQWEIKQAKTVNAHFGEIGVNSLPFLRERGVKFTMHPGVPFGYTWAIAAEGKRPEWNPRPYGDHGFNYDAMPDHPEFFNVVAHPLGAHKLKGMGMGTSDFLWWNTRFWHESEFNDIGGAAEKGARIIKLGLDGGFFGCLMTHEQRIATLSSTEWEEILGRMEQLTSKYEKVFESYDHIAEYAKSKYDTKILEASHNPISKEVRLRLAGRSALPLKLYLFTDDICRYELKEIPAFEGEQEITLK